MSYVLVWYVLCSYEKYNGRVGFKFHNILNTDLKAYTFMGYLALFTEKLRWS